MSNLSAMLASPRATSEVCWPRVRDVRCKPHLIPAPISRFYLEASFRVERQNGPPGLSNPGGPFAFSQGSRDHS